MNLLSISRVNYQFTFWCTISLFISQKFHWLSISRIHYLFRKFTINQLSFSPVHLYITIYSANSLWIFYQFCELTLKQISITRINYWSTLFFENSLSIWPINFDFAIFFANLPLRIYYLRINYSSTIFFANLLWIYYPLCELTINLLFFS